MFEPLGIGRRSMMTDLTTGSEAYAKGRIPNIVPRYRGQCKRMRLALGSLGWSQSAPVGGRRPPPPCYAATRSWDLDNLTLATPRLNRHEKVARDAAEWLPERNRCWCATTIIAVRREYGLTIDRRESAALDAVLAGCE